MPKVCISTGSVCATDAVFVGLGALLWCVSCVPPPTVSEAPPCASRQLKVYQVCPVACSRLLAHGACSTRCRGSVEQLCTALLADRHRACFRQAVCCCQPTASNHTLHISSLDSLTNTHRCASPMWIRTPSTSILPRRTNPAPVTPTRTTAHTK